MEAREVMEVMEAREVAEVEVEVEVEVESLVVEDEDEDEDTIVSGYEPHGSFVLPGQQR